VARVSDALEPEVQVLLVGPADATVHLGRDTRDLTGDFGDVSEDVTRHQRRLVRDRVEAVGGVPEQRSRGLDLGDHLRTHMLHGLKRADQAIELLALLGVGHGLLDHRLTGTEGIGGERDTTRVEHAIDRIFRAFDGKQARLPTQAILRQAVPFNPSTHRPNWEGIERLVADYANVNVPVLLLWGDRDETLPLSMGYKLLAELPNARLRIVRGGKHSLQADRPGLVSDWIERFVEDPGEDWAPLELVD